MNRDVLSAEAIAGMIGDAEVRSGVQVHATLPSTNARAMELAAKGVRCCLVVADTQTAGRGSSGRSFFSPPGTGVYMSLLTVRPVLCDPSSATLVAAVAVSRALDALSGKRTQIKWFNDVCLDGRKICGILAEGVPSEAGAGLSGVVIGIGINCFSPEGGFPDEILPKAGALFSAGEAAPSRNEIVARVTNALLGEAAEGGFPGTLTAYRNRLSGLGGRVRVVFGGGGFEGLACGVDGAGGLVVRRDSGDTVTLVHGIHSILPAADTAEGQGGI